MPLSQKYAMCKLARQQQVERYFETIAREDQIQDVRKPSCNCKKDVQGDKKCLLPRGNRAVSFSQELCLQSAVEELDEKEVMEALGKGINFSFTTGNGTSLLHKAAMEGCGSMAELLIVGGADVNCQDSDWWTPLHIACYHDNFEVAQVLLKAYSDPLLMDVDGNFPVDLCCDSSDIRNMLMEFMAEQGIRPEQMKELKAQREQVLEQVLKSLQAVPENLSRPVHNGITLLHIASANGFVKVAEHLLQNGARVNVADGWGMTPLHCAVKFNQIKMVKLLVAYGADVTATNYGGFQVVELAASTEVEQALQPISTSLRMRRSAASQDTDGGGDPSREHEERGLRMTRSVCSPHALMAKADRLSEARMLKNLLSENKDSASLKESVKDEDTTETNLDENDNMYYSSIWKMENAEVNLLPEKMTTDDLAEMSLMDEGAVLDTLTSRYEARLIYTYIGDILVAMNPFSQLHLYGKSVSVQYHKNQDCHSQLTPHIYGVAERAYRAMLSRGVPQCCVIGGESGSGKTESCKHIMQHLLWNAGSLETDLLVKLAQMNPLLEAFGNASTVLNSNSSRFAKFLTVTFSTSGKVLGGQVNEFLLEKSRVVDQRPDENNFHIFYWMLAGVTPEEASRCRLQNVSFRYLKTDKNKQHNQQHISELKTKFWEVKDSLRFIGFTTEDVTCVVMILSATLHMGNIAFSSKSGDDDDSAVITNNDVVKNVCGLLKISEEDFCISVLEDVISTQGDQVRRPLTPVQAREGVDGLAKALYSRLFSWIIHGLNQMVQAPPDSNSDHLSIGVLDLFGFENLSQNGFEQMCINLANEKLQIFYNMQVFDNEKKDCIDEGIPFMDIQLSQNSDVISLFMKKNTGIFDLLDEESMFPKATDVSLAAKLHTVAGQCHPTVYTKPKYGGTSFTVVHYAGLISYSLSGILKTNKNLLKPSLSFVMRGSESLIVKELFHSQMSYTGSIRPSQRQRVSRHLKGAKSPLDFFRRFKTSKKDNQNQKAQRTREVDRRKDKHMLTYHFRNSLDKLVTRIKNCSCHFVRCIKPNREKLPMTLVKDFVESQLRYTGIYETVRIRKEGYPIRATYSEFLAMYPTLAGLIQKDLDSDNYEVAQRLLVIHGVSDFQVGQTKIFLRQKNVNHLNNLEKEKHDKIVKAQSIVRRHLCWKQAEDRRVCKKMYSYFLADFAEDLESRQSRMSRFLDYLGQADNEKIRLEKDRKEAAQYVNLLDSVLDAFSAQLGLSEECLEEGGVGDSQTNAGQRKYIELLDYHSPSKSNVDATFLKKKTRPAPLPPVPKTLSTSSSSLSSSLSSSSLSSSSSSPAAKKASTLSVSRSAADTPVDARQMDPSQNFPPSPREMYMYRPAQQINGHNVSPSPSRGRPPPVLPERRPETQLGNRTSRSSISSRGSHSSELASPPQSPGFAGHRHHNQQQQGTPWHSENKPFSYATGTSYPLQSANSPDSRTGMERDVSPHGKRGNIQCEGGGAGFQRYHNDCSPLQHDNSVVYQRIDKDYSSSSDNVIMSGGRDYHCNRDFQGHSCTRQSDDIYGQFVEPSNGSHHRPSLTYVPPPVVPPMQTEFWKEEKVAASKPQSVELHQQQKPQQQPHKVKAPTPQGPPPPPPPPLRNSSSQIPPQPHLSNVGSRSPRSGSPARVHSSGPHISTRQPTTATIDELAQVRLRSVSDSNPHSPLQSPVSQEVSSGSGAINVRLRPTPGKFGNIYAEEETTLPPPLDDLDELPPPPPPPELLNEDLSGLALTPTPRPHHPASSLQQPHHQQQPAAAAHSPPGEANSSLVDHRQPPPQQPLWQQQWTTSPSPANNTNQECNSPSISRAGRSASFRNTGAAENSSGFDHQKPRSMSNMDFEVPDDIDLSQCPGLVEINKSTPNWKRDMIEKKNQEKIEEYVKKILKEREQEAKWKNVPDWKKKILQKKEEEESATGSKTETESKLPAGKKPAKKAPVPPPKEAKDDSASQKPRSDIVPAALSIDPEELAAMPPWKQELLFKRDKVPVTFSNEFNPDDEAMAGNENAPC